MNNQLFDSKFGFDILSDNIAAQKDIWIMGDSTLAENFHTLPAMRREAKISIAVPPYLYDQYNVMAYQMSNSQIKNVLTCFVNSFIEGINENRIPRMIIVMLDIDLLNCITKQNLPGSLKNIGKCVAWLTRYMERTIETKKEHLYNISRCINAK